MAGLLVLCKTLACNHHRAGFTVEQPARVRAPMQQLFCSIHGRACTSVTAAPYCGQGVIIRDGPWASLMRGSLRPDVAVHPPVLPGNRPKPWLRKCNAAMQRLVQLILWWKNRLSVTVSERVLLWSPGALSFGAHVQCPSFSGSMYRSHECQSLHRLNKQRVIAAAVPAEVAVSVRPGAANFQCCPMSC